MKIYFALFFLCFLPSLLCQTEPGGIKIALNERLIYSALNRFFSNITKYLNDFNIPDIRFFKGCNAREVRGKISNFSKDRVKIELTPNGIHLMLNGLQGQITTTVYSSFLIIRFHNNAKVTVNDLSLDATIRIVTKIKDGRKLLSAQFVGVPGYRLKYRISMDGALNKILSAVAKYFADKQIVKIMNDKIDGYLADAIESLQLKTQVDPYKNYWIDYSLVNDVRHKSGFMEMNVYGLFYKEGNSLTQNRNLYSLSQLPIINKMENEFQLYISEYSLNMALNTIIQSNTYHNRLKIDDIKTQFLNILLPGIEKTFGKTKATVFLSYSTPKLEILENSINCPITGTVQVKVEGVNKPAYYLSYSIVLSLDLKVLPGPSISAKILDLTAKTTTLYINDVTGAPNDVFERVVEIVKAPTLAIIDLLLKDDIKMNFKQILGLTFRDISLTHNNHYLTVKYNLS